MMPWLVAVLVLLLGGLGPAVWLGVRGTPVQRLVGLELASSITVLILLLLAQVAGQSQWLVVPLTLVLLSFAGTLVFTRLLAPGS
jgi:multisubunit Na+/H+ antiporter MnhF subunit